MAEMPAVDWRVTRLSRRRSTVTRAQVETVVGRALGVFGLVFGAQTVPMALAQAGALMPGAGAALMAVLYGAIVGLAVATITKVAVRTASLAFALLYALALVAWPFLVDDPAALEGATPWLYYLCTVATTAAVVAVPPAWAAVYTLVVPAVYGVIRFMPSGGDAGPLLAVLDAMYAVVLGVVVLVIVTMLRQAAGAVDSAQEAALERYDLAARLHANEIERVKVDALVHDSVLTTLLSAAAATTPDQQQLAARMARDAVQRLDEAGATGPRALDRVGLPVLVRRLRAALTTFTTPFTVRVVNAGGVELPVEAVEALHAAAVQAMVNSLQHADEPGLSTRRELRIRGVRAGGCVIEVADSGRGFVLEEVPAERLGLRVSIEERMVNAGGAAHIESRIGHGTTVTLAWPQGAGGA
ncbi:Signal transduction histidine kinase [Agromyces cerinus subsp. cerinus]|uniref:Signal transduction histidine kinase n=2 Tax=Agromyces cerinus TaxID=33878 RepID=A0A1N6DHH2_9MICO|nr:Signal transduction histidine kinase [Agromyces cerinus subsp. cerinus]